MQTPDVTAERARLNAEVAAILTTLAEVGGESPRTPIYMALGSNLARFEGVESLLKAAGLITGTSEVITLTEKGRAMAAKCEAALKGGA